MKKLLIILCFTMILFSNLFPQKGFGFTTYDAWAGGWGEGGGTITYINKTPDATWEPSLSYTSVSTEYDDESSTNGDVTDSYITLGIGYLKPNYATDNFSGYWGVRLFYTIISETLDGDISDVYDDYEGSSLSLAGVYGAEYHLSSNFSLGGELRLIYSMPENGYDEDDNYRGYHSSEERTTISISPLIYLRFYR